MILGNPRATPAADVSRTGSPNLFMSRPRSVRVSSAPASCQGSAELHPASQHTRRRARHGARCCPEEPTPAARAVRSGTARRAAEPNEPAPGRPPWQPSRLPAPDAPTLSGPSDGSGGSLRTSSSQSSRVGSDAWRCRTVYECQFVGQGVSDRAASRSRVRSASISGVGWGMVPRMVVPTPWCESTCSVPLRASSRSAMLVSP